MTRGEFKQVQVGDFLVEGTDHLIEVDCLHPNGASYWEDGDWKVAKIDNLKFPSPRMRPHWYHVDDRTPVIDEEVICSMSWALFHSPTWLTQRWRLITTDGTCREWCSGDHASLLMK